jgi:hypothetical protein
MRNAIFLVPVLMGAAVSGALLSPPNASHITLDREAEPLKSTFNGDVGKTRILLLVAPT